MMHRSLPWLLALGLLAMGPFSAPVQAQEEEENALEIGVWHPTVEAGLNLTQSAFSDNWAGGDNGSIVWTFIGNASLEKRFSETVHWNNRLKLAYGQTHKQNDEREWEKPDKSTDRIDLESILRWTVGWPVEPYVSGRLESQFHDSSDPDGRTLLFTPLFVREGAGFSHEFYTDEENRSLLVRAGASLRHGIRRQFVDPAPEDATTTEVGTDGGLELIFDYQTQLFEEKVSWTSRLGFLQPFFYSGKSDLEDLTSAQLEAAGVDPDVADYTTTMDIDWENVFTSQITSVLSVNLYVRWVYDKYDTSVKPLLEEGDLTNPEDVQLAIRKAGQFKQTLALGLTYRFF